MVAVSGIGCSGGGDGAAPPDPSTMVLDNKAALKAQLEMIAKDGQTGSALAGMQEGVQKIGDPALTKDYQRLEKAKNPEQAKKIAQEMMAKL
jgi:hypothetical protein